MDRDRRRTKKVFRGWLTVLTAVAIGCGDTPRVTDVSTGLARGAAARGRYQMPLTDLLVIAQDRRLANGILVSLKLPFADRGIDDAHRLLGEPDRLAAANYLFSQFPNLDTLRGVKSIVTVQTTDGPRLDTLVRWFVVIRAPASTNELSDLAASPVVDFLEPNWTNALSRGEGRPAFTVLPANSEWRPWAIDTVRADNAWRLGYHGDEVDIRIVDTGIDKWSSGHPDLAVDSGTTMFNAWWHQADKTCFAVLDPCWYEQRHHGTGVYGMLAAAMNGVGSVGVAPAPVPWLGVANVRYDATSGPRMEQGDFAAGVDFVTNYHPAGRRIAVTSVGYASADTLAYQVLHDAFKTSAASGILWFAAAGGPPETGQNILGIPSLFAGVIAVGGVTTTLQPIPESPNDSKLEFVAPAEDLVTSWNRQSDLADPYEYTLVVSGTSFAAPVVAGVARLAWDAYPGWTAAQLRSELQSHARDLGVAGKDNVYGYGMPDAVCIIQQYLPCVVPPRLLTSIVGPTSVRPNAACLWSASVTGGRSPFRYQWTVNGVIRGNSSTFLWTSGSSSFTVGLLVTDVDEESASASRSVSVSAGAPICRT